MLKLNLIIMKLISMTDFVLNQSSVLEIYINHSKDPLFDRCVRYAQFLKQPLKLEMFIGENALFEGWEMIEANGYHIVYRHKDFFLVSKLGNLIIEDLIEYKITLTQHAIKQLGL